jgi:hypothetical protein
MKIAMINSGCSHTQDRFLRFLQYLNAHYYHTPEDFVQGDYSLIFIEASCKIDISGKIGGAKIIFFDCEDDPSHWEPGPSFFALQDTALAYGKIVVQADRPVSNLREIKLPIIHYLYYREVCEANRNPQQIDQPYFIGSPTTIGKYNLKYPESELPLVASSFLAKAEDGNFIFNQRFQWLLQMEKAGIKGNMGVIWGQSNLSLEWQTKHFGDIGRFGVNRVDFNDQLRNCLSYKINFAPGGMCRWTFRTLDMMATGAPYLSADYDKKELLYMPKHCIVVKDHENVADYYQAGLNEKDFAENREELRDLTPEKIWNKFVKQLN